MKLVILKVIKHSKMSLPVRERGLKHLTVAGKLLPPKSLPVRERGLKREVYPMPPYPGWSLPVRERGLKLCRPIVCASTA